MRARRLLLSALAATAAITAPAGASENPVTDAICKISLGCASVDADAGEGNVGAGAAVDFDRCVPLAQLTGDAMCVSGDGVGAGAGAATPPPSSNPVTASCVRSGSVIKVSINARPNAGVAARSVSIYCAVIAYRSNRGHVSASSSSSNAAATATVPYARGEKLCFGYDVTWTDWSTSSYSMFGMPACQVDER